MQRLTTWLLGFVAASALGAGVPALVWAGRLAGLPAQLAPLMVAIVDGTMIVMSLAAVTRRGRGEPARWMWSTTAALVLGSATVQCVHALDVTSAADTASRVVAAAVGSVPPFTVLLATHAWLDLAVAPAPSRVRRGRPTTAGQAAPATPAPSAPASRPAREASRPRSDDVARSDRLAQIHRLANDEGLSQRAIAVRLGTSKSMVARVLAKGKSTSDDISSLGRQVPA